MPGFNCRCTSSFGRRRSGPCEPTREIEATFELRVGHSDATENAMKQRLFLVLASIGGSASLLLFGGCDGHTWEETKPLHQEHGAHAHGDEPADHDGGEHPVEPGDKAAAEGGRGDGAKKAEH